MKKSNILFLIILSALIIALGVFRFMSNHVADNPVGTVGNTPGNLYNKGMVCEYDGYVYFHNYTDQGTLYRMKPNETEPKQIIKESVAYINVAGNYVYYYQNHDNNSGADLAFLSRNLGIYRSTLKGKNTICLQKAPVTTVALINSDVYYQYFDNTYGLNLYKKHINNTKEEQITDEPVPPLCPVNNVIYYAKQTGDHNLCSLNITNGSISTVFNGNIWNPIVTGGYVYYMNNLDDYALYRRKLGDVNEEKLTDDRIDCYNVVNNSWIYYQSNSTIDPAVKRMHVDGSENEVVMRGNFTEINASSMYVYFRPFDNETMVYHQLINGPVNPQAFVVKPDH